VKGLKYQQGTTLSRKTLSEHHFTFRAFRSLLFEFGFERVEDRLVLTQEG